VPDQLTRVLLCDDHPVYRDGLRLLLTELGFEVVGEAGTGEEAVDACSRLRPDVVVMDLHLPGISGVEATQRIVGADPTMPVLVVTMLDDDTTLFAALRAGARGYLLKGAGRADVERALRTVTAGDVVLSGTVLRHLRGAPAPAPGSAFGRLTARESEVLSLVARGRTNDQIARSLFLSVKTVRNNVSSILTKLGATSRAELVAMARDGGIGAPP
jgi:DNA-binding NarL/FixJ family response regulator